MCNQNTLQLRIATFTKDGEDIARFLADTLNGETPGVKVNHRLEAAKQLIKHGFPNDQAAILDRLSRAGGNPEGQGEGTPPSADPVQVTHLDILNYEIAHLIRHETAEGHTVVEFLIHTMTGKRQAIHTQKVPHQARRPYGSSKRTPASRLRRPRLTPQALRHHRRGKRLRHPAHRPRQANARVQRARRRHRPLPARSDVRSRP